MSDALWFGAVLVAATVFFVVGFVIGVWCSQPRRREW